MSALPRRVVVTGSGLVSPLGDSPAALHEALIAGRSARRPIELFPTTELGAGGSGAGGGGGAAAAGGEIRPFEPHAELGSRNLRPLDRTSRLLVTAAHRALGASGWDAAALAAVDVGLVVGTTFCSVRTIAEFDRRGRLLGPGHASPFEFANSVINAAAGQTAIWHRLRGVNSTLAAGEASALLAIAQAVEMVRSGRGAAVLAGGAEEMCLESFLGYQRAGRMAGDGEGGEARPVPFDARRNGFSLSEGAALLMLEDAAAAAARGARIEAEVLGWGSSFAVAGDVAAAALARAVAQALADAGLEPSGLDCVSAGANGSVAGDRAEAAGLALALRAGRDDGDGRDEGDGRAGRDGHEGRDGAGAIPVVAIKAMLGEGLGVSGAWQAIDLISTLAGGVLPGIAGLVECDHDLPLGSLSPSIRRLAPAVPAGRPRRGLLTAIGADGHCAALILQAASQEEAPA